MLSWMRSRIAARWAVWRINRWINLRRAGVAHETALRRSLLTAHGAYRILDEVLGCGISTVGLAEVRGRSITLCYDFKQIELVLKSLADLTRVLPAEERAKIAALVGQLRIHNWGGVRRGAEAAHDVLESEDKKKSDKALEKALADLQAANAS